MAPVLVFKLLIAIALETKFAIGTALFRAVAAPDPVLITSCATEAHVEDAVDDPTVKLQLVAQFCTQTLSPFFAAVEPVVRIALTDVVVTTAPPEPADVYAVIPKVGVANKVTDSKPANREPSTFIRVPYIHWFTLL